MIQEVNKQLLTAYVAYSPDMLSQQHNHEPRLAMTVGICAEDQKIS